jgi:hypothetical protein
MGDIIEDIRSIRKCLINGTESIPTTDLIIDEGEEKIKFNYVFPNLISLYLNIALISKISAKILFNDIDINLRAESNTSILASQQTGELYNVFENVISSIIFSCMALEAFCNQLIPDDFIDSYGRNKKEIEKKTELITKIKYLIPNIYEIPSPSQLSEWASIIELNKLRNELVHLKSDSGIFIKKQLDFLTDSLIKFIKVDYYQNILALMQNMADNLNDNPKFKFHYMMPYQIKVDDWNWVVPKKNH